MMSVSHFHIRVTFLNILLLHFLLQHQKLLFPLQYRKPQGSALHLSAAEVPQSGENSDLTSSWIDSAFLSDSSILLAVDLGCAVPPPIPHGYTWGGCLCKFIISVQSPAIDSHNVRFLPSWSLLPGVCSDSTLRYRSPAATSPKLKLIFKTI